VAKELSYDEVASRKDKAERFVRDVLQDESRADEIDNEDVADYADRRGFTIIDNIGRRKGMPRKNKDDTITDLQDHIEDLRAENDLLQNQLDQISDVLAGSGDDEYDDDSD
jgi:hypothetical protein